MKFSFATALAVLSGLDYAEAGTTFFAQCPKAGTDYQTVQGLSLANYAGRWYEIQRDREFVWETMATCATATYTLKDEAAGKISVVNRAYAWWWFFSYYSFEGEAYCKTQGKCSVGFFGPAKTFD